MIKSTVVKAEEKKADEYPCLKISDFGQIVYFTGPKTGVKLTGGEYYKDGHLLQDWAEYNFKPFNGTVTLENE